VTGFTGQLVWDCTKPDGTPRKLMDVSRLAAGISLEDGLRGAYAWFLAHKSDFRN
jgi:GDP-L-fucose synthase